MKAKVEYTYFGFEDWFRGMKTVRNMFILFFGLGYFTRTYFKRRNRNIVKKLKQ